MRNNVGYDEIQRFLVLDRYNDFNKIIAFQSRKKGQFFLLIDYMNSCHLN